MRYEDDHAVAARDALAFHTFGYYFEFENISFLHTDIISHIAAQVQRRRISCGCRLAEYDFFALSSRNEKIYLSAHNPQKAAHNTIGGENGQEEKRCGPKAGAKTR